MTSLVHNIFKCRLKFSRGIDATKRHPYKIKQPVLGFKPKICITPRVHWVVKKGTLQINEA